MAIKDIEVGDEVAAMDEKSGAKVWRRVIEIFSKTTRNTIDLELEDANGKRIKIKTNWNTNST